MDRPPRPDEGSNVVALDDICGGIVTSCTACGGPERRVWGELVTVGGVNRAILLCRRCESAPHAEGYHVALLRLMARYGP